MSTETTPSRPRNIASVMLAVRDLDAAIASYAKLGFGVTHRARREEEGVESAYLDTQGVFFELVAPTDTTKQWGRELQEYLDQRGEGLYAAAFSVDDVRAEHKHLQSQGVEVGEPYTAPPEAGVDAQLLSMVGTSATHGAYMTFVEFSGGLPEPLQS